MKYKIILFAILFCSIKIWAQKTPKFKTNELTLALMMKSHNQNAKLFDTSKSKTFTWLDQSGNENHVSHTITNANEQYSLPTIQRIIPNKTYNGGIRFLNFNGYSFLYNSKPQKMDFTSCTVFIVSQANITYDTYMNTLISIADLKSTNDNQEFLISGNKMYHHMFDGDQTHYNYVYNPNLLRNDGDFKITTAVFGKTQQDMLLCGYNNCDTLENIRDNAEEYKPIPRHLYIGMRKHYGEVLNGNIAEILVYKGKLNPKQQKEVQQYLTQKYKLNPENNSKHQSYEPLQVEVEHKIKEVPTRYIETEPKPEPDISKNQDVSNYQETFVARFNQFEGLVLKYPFSKTLVFDFKSYKNLPKSEGFLLVILSQKQSEPNTYLEFKNENKIIPITLKAYDIYKATLYQIATQKIISEIIIEVFDKKE